MKQQFINNDINKDQLKDFINNNLLYVSYDLNSTNRVLKMNWYVLDKNNMIQIAYNKASGYGMDRTFSGFLDLLNAYGLNKDKDNIKQQYTKLNW